MEAEIDIRGRNFDFSVPLGEGPASVTGGGAEYEEGRRPKADAVTLFNGNALLKVDVPILLDAWRVHRKHPELGINLWPRVQQILSLCIGTDRSDPPDFTVTGPIPYSGHRFQMELPEWGEGLRANNGALVRQALTLHLIEFNDPTTIRFHRAKRSGLGSSKNGGTTAPPSSTRLQAPKSLIEIAAEVYGDPGLASALGKVNGIHDLRKKQKVGTVIKLPPRLEQLRGG